jgi:Flp pilus assembly protein TadD
MAGALACYKKAAACDPPHAPSFSNLGVALYEQQDLEGAAAALQRATEIDPGYGPAHNGLGLVLHARRDLTGAEAAYRKAATLLPKFSTAHYNLGVALLDQGRPQEAEVSLAKAVEIFPKYAQAHRARGITLWRQGRLAEAHEAVRRAYALGFDPDKQDGLAVPLAQRLGRILDLQRRDPAPTVTPEEARAGLRGRLAVDDPLDVFPPTFQSHRKSHLLRLPAGHHYLVELRGDLDVWLRVEDANYATRAVVAGGHHVRLVFTVPADGLYRLVVAHREKGATGAYTLSVREVSRVGEGQLIQGKLESADDVVDGKHRKAHPVELTAGRPYVFELDSALFDGAMVLLDPEGKEVALQSAVADLTKQVRLDFTPAQAGTYTLVITTRRPRQTGPYTLRIESFEPQ